MNIKGNTVLITGGATGIGFALADAFLMAGNTVIICGRRLEKLDAARNNILYSIRSIAPFDYSIIFTPVGRSQPLVSWLPT
jgi:short-subunit dehydrogenase involved in D-alanine esterification of teichoic acids